MKKILLFTLALSLPLAQAVRAQDNDHDEHHAHAAAPVAHAPVAHAAVAPARHVVQHPVHQIQHAVAPNRHVMNTREVPHAQVIRRENNRAQAANEAAARARYQNQNAHRGDEANRHFDRDHPHYVQHNNSHRQFNRNSFSVARGRVIRERHDHDWWRNHYRNSSFVLFGGGYYYLNDGYWYPAYGYSPIYNNYSYNEPIYSYNDLPPGQVLENVQIALRDQGYYQGAIDGLIGPATRAALAAFQRDHGLVETAAVDEPTLVTLGLS